VAILPGLTNSGVKLGKRAVDALGIVDDVPLGALDEAGDAGGLLRAVPEDQIGTSQPFKLRKGEDGVSVFDGVSPQDVLAELPGDRVPNTTVTIPRDRLPTGTQIIPIPDPRLSQRLSDAHRILVRPEGWSMDRFARTLKKIVGWGE
jgi:hypothetical protein